MAEGLIQKSMGRPDGEDLTVEEVRGNIQVPPELQQAYERVVLAGMKVMFTKETHRLMLKEIQRPGLIADRLANGITGLILLLFKESNNTIPPQVIIPAAVELLMQAADFVRRSKLEKVTNKDLGNAMERMITLILQKFGVEPDQLEQMLNQFENSRIDAAAQQMGAMQ